MYDFLKILFGSHQPQKYGYIQSRGTPSRRSWKVEYTHAQSTGGFLTLDLHKLINVTMYISAFEMAAIFPLQVPSSPGGLTGRIFAVGALASGISLVFFGLEWGWSNLRFQ